MKVLWITDFNIDLFIGGAQLANKKLIDCGRKLGVEIDECNIQSELVNKLHNNIHNEYDIIITGTLIHFSKVSGFIDWLSYIPNHIRLEHDATPYLTKSLRDALFNNNLLNIFTSEQHREFYIQNFGNLYKNIPYYITTPIIDTNVFYDFKQQRENTTLWIGLSHYLKGIDRLHDKIVNNQDSKFALCILGGGTDEFKKYNNVQILDIISNDFINTYYNKYTNFFYSPNQQESFCMTVIEAILCGMNVDVDNKEYWIPSIQLYNKIGKENIRKKFNEEGNNFWKQINEHNNNIKSI